MGETARERGAFALVAVGLLSAGALAGLACSKSTSEATDVAAPEARPLVGVKIYEPVADTDALFRDWRRLGIDAAFVSTTLAESGSFIPAARGAGFKALIITPVFFNPEYLADHPDAWAITGRGERARDDWVEFVCPVATTTDGSERRTSSDSWRRINPMG